jgi:hypothetical protein
VVLDPGGFPIAPYDPDHDVSDPAIAWNGSACLVVWQGPDPAEPTVTAMRRALVTPAGAVLDPGASGVAASLAPLDLAFDGQGFLLTGHTIDAATQDALVWGVRLGPDLRRRAR